MRSSSNDWLLLFIFFCFSIFKIGIKESNISHHETYKHTQTENDKRMFNNCLYLIIK